MPPTGYLGYIAFAHLRTLLQAHQHHGLTLAFHINLCRPYVHMLSPVQPGVAARATPTVCQYSIFVELRANSTLYVLLVPTCQVSLLHLRIMHCHTLYYTCFCEAFGRVNQKVEPWPGVLSTPTWP